MKRVQVILCGSLFMSVSISNAQTHIVSLFEFSPTTNVRLTGVAADGTFAGTYVGSVNGFQGSAMRVRPGEAPETIRPSDATTSAEDMTEDGVLFGADNTGGGKLPFTYASDNTLNYLPAPSDDFELFGMNGNQDYIGQQWNQDTFSYEPFMFVGGVKTMLPTNLRPKGIANDGTVVGYDMNAFRGFIRDPLGNVTNTWLDEIGAISDDGLTYAGSQGNLLVVSIRGNEYYTSFTPDILPSNPLGFSGESLGSLASMGVVVGDVTNDGIVVGYISTLYNATGGGLIPRQFGFVANPVPEPGTMAVLGGALAMLARRRRK